jgi:hypothetical protein
MADPDFVTGIIAMQDFATSSNMSSVPKFEKITPYRRLPQCAYKPTSTVVAFLCFDYPSSVRSDFASSKSSVSKPSVNQP